MVVPTNYLEVDTILGALYSEINGYDFYRYIFPCNERSGDFNSDFSCPNAVYLYRDENVVSDERSLRRRIMLSDTWEDDYITYVEGNPMTLCSGLSYRGRANKLVNAQRMHALIFDLDGVGEYELKNLMLRWKASPTIIRSLPLPTFVVLSGQGLHIYYVFDVPVDLFPNIKVQLKSLKYDLTFRMWEYKSTSQQKEIQYQSINQGFRMVGSVNDKYGVVVKAYQLGDRVSLAYLNQYVDFEAHTVDINKPYSPSRMSRAAAKELYPEWYQRVVVEKNMNARKWDIAGKVNGGNPYALYDWWKGRVNEVKGGHRYFFLMCMVIYACKCDVPEDQLIDDMYEVFDILKTVEHTNRLTKNDIESALEAYDKAYYNFTIDDIVKLTDIPIEKNKRNGRKQALHLQIARATRDIIHKDWREGNGRPRGSDRKMSVVEKYIEAHPDCYNIAQIARECKVSRPTVYKYLYPEKYATRQNKRKLDGVKKGQPTVDTVKPSAFVVEGDPDMMSKLMSFAQQGVRQVEILTQKEYDERMAAEVIDMFLSDRGVNADE